MKTIVQHILQYFNIWVVLALLAAALILSRHKRYNGIVILLNIFISLRYIFWRGFFTLNAADYIALAISVTLLLVELYGFAQNALFYYQSGRPSAPELPAGSIDYFPTVDILITILNEPKEILYRTIIGCNAQDYPKDRFKVYVLDDGGRDDIKRLSGELGCHYITRNTNRDAKAGNLNNAIGHTNGEVVAIFDCDHIPVRSFLKETVGFFLDPKVAIVQVPHHFYNPDTFQRNLKLEREMTNEQDLFFHVIQPGKDSYNSAFFAGSCGLFRRSALAEIGGIETRTITEDLHTSMVLHSRGYKSVYVNKDLSAGLAPESCSGYLKQRQRWAKGGVQVFMLDNPLLKKGLGFHQRLNYLASVLYFFHGFPRVVYLSAPLAYFLFKYPPLVTDVKTLLNYFLPHYIVTIAAFGAVSKGYRNPFWSDVYETLMSFVLTIAAFKAVVRPAGHVFAVTPKGERHNDAKFETSIIMPHIILLGLLVLGAFIGVKSLIDRTGVFDAIVVSLVWTLYNIVILFTAVIAARERPQRRGSIRLTRRIKCVLTLRGESISCVTKDLTETGVSVRLDKPVVFDSVIGVELISGYGEATRLKGVAVRNDRESDGSIVAGINFINMDREMKDGVIRQMFSSENSWSGFHEEGVPAGSWSFAAQVLSAFLALFKRDRSLKRSAPRFFVSIPGGIGGPESARKGKTREISLSGLSMEVSGEETVPKEVLMTIQPKGSQTITVKGEVVWQVREKSKRLVGVRFSDPEDGKALWDMIRSR